MSLRRRASSVAIALVAVVSLTGTALAAVPTAGRQVISDGTRRIAVLSDDRATLTVAEPRSQRAVGEPIAMPRNSGGHRLVMNPVGVIGTRVFLAGNDPDALPPAPNPGYAADRMAIASPATGAIQWLCAPAGTTPGSVVPECLKSSTFQDLPFGTYPAVVQAGRRSLLVQGGDLSFTDVVSWSTASGQFDARWATPTQRKALLRKVSNAQLVQNAPLDLDAKTPGPLTRFGYTVLPGNSPITRRTTYVVRRDGDRRSAKLSFKGHPINAAFRGYGQRGLCVSSGKRIVLWDHTTRRIWRRTAPAGTGPSSNVLCPGSSVVVGTFDHADPTFASKLVTDLRWPTDHSHAGWTRSARLMPGDSRRY